jgi:hypothetical protein
VRLDRAWRGGIGGAAAGLIAAAAAGSGLLGAGPAGAAVSAVSAQRPAYHAKTVTYLGHRFSVPSSWQVVDLTAHPSACVRFDVHAVYLGNPGADQQCPARGAGRRTGALLIRPVQAPRAAESGIIALDDSTSAEIQVTAPGIAVTASYGDDRATVLSALAAAGLPQPAPDTAAALASTGQSPAHSSAPVDVVQGTNVVTGLGFDTCTAPSAQQMQAWATSPFNTVGIYIGGSERACAQPNLTPAWITARAASGWHFMPLYVGWQAAWDSLTATAPATLGRQDADDAVVQARSLGFGPGTLLYYDMESYKTTAQSAAAMAFLSAWSAELHAKGYRSAVYSSLSTGIADLVAHHDRMTEPDAVDIAHWNGVADADSNVTPALMWPQQRAHQYLGNNTATYGGVTMTVDNDYLYVSLPVCAPTPSPAPTPTPTPTPKPTPTPTPSRTATPSPSLTPSQAPKPSASATPSASPRPSTTAPPPPGPGPSGSPVPVRAAVDLESNRLGTC